jgi:hypothetical protein
VKGLRISADSSEREPESSEHLRDRNVGQVVDDDTGENASSFAAAVTGLPTILAIAAVHAQPTIA